jgi:phosphoserine phosphatase RsbU/P
LSDSQERQGPATIGLLIDWLDSDYASSLCFALAEEVNRRGLRFLCFVGQSLQSLDAPLVGSNIAYALASPRALDALVVVTLGMGLSAEDQARYLERYRPLPMCTYTLDIPGVPSVAVDNAAGMHHAVSHLIQFHERRRIAFVRGPLGNMDSELRYQGYRAALAEFNLAYDERLDVAGNFLRASGRRAIASLLDERRVDFDAVVAANDRMAAGAQVELLARGIRVPEDVAVCGFDDVEDARFASVPISSVRQPWRAQARLAVDLIQAELAGRRVPAPAKVPAEFVPRRSCGCEVALEWGGMSLTRHRGRDRTELFDADSILAPDPAPRRLVDMLLEILATHGIGLEPATALALVEGFKSGLHDTGERFLDLLEHELSRGLREAVSLSGWYHGLAFVRREVLAMFPGDRDARLAGEQLMHLAFERVSYAAERQQAMRRLEFERQGRVLTLTTEALITAFDMKRVEAALRERLPELGLASFCVSHYEEDGQALPRLSRVLLAHDSERDLRAASDALFDTAALVSDGFWPSDRPGAFVVEPLHFQGERLGVAVFEVGPRQGAIYLTLREQLSAALKGKRLIAQIAEQSLQRQQAERARFEQEVQLARRIQSAIVPEEVAAVGLDVAAAIVPGGPGAAGYYDVRRQAGSVWFAVGQVQGDGIGASLLVPMLGSVVRALCRHKPAAAPHELLAIAQSVLLENVRSRMQHEQRVSLLLAHYAAGRLSFAGDFDGVWLHRPRASERDPYAKPWLASGAGGARVWTGSVELEAADVVVLHTAALERADAPGAPGLELGALWSELLRSGDSPARGVRDALIGAAQPDRGRASGDLALIVLRRSGEA